MKIEILIPSAIGLLTTIAAAYLSARFATRKAFQEKWWERKERSYSEIIQTLYHSIRYYDLYADICIQHKDLDHPRMEEFGKAQTEAYWKLQEITEIGAFVISDEAAKILEELRKRPKLKSTDGPIWELLEEESKHFREALRKLRECARKDLKI